jgi:GNAT superfamily N-acetyltransferase
VPGALGKIAEMHGTYYQENWGMDGYFEAKVAWGLGEFYMRFDPARDGIWIARDGEKIVGGIIIDGSQADTEGARLRYFILAPEYHGRGLGNKLMDLAMTFCREKGFRRVYLTTISGLNPARHLYEKFGFRLYHEQEDDHWGTVHLEQEFEALLEPQP